MNYYFLTHPTIYILTFIYVSSTDKLVNVQHKFWYFYGDKNKTINKNPKINIVLGALSKHEK